MDEFMRAAIAEAEQGLSEGGIPIGSVLVHNGRIIGRGEPGPLTQRLSDFFAERTRGEGVEVV